MHITIRADILNAALHAVARSNSGMPGHRLVFPNRSNDRYSFADVVSNVPVIGTMLEEYIATGSTESNPAYAFFSVDPPGIWMRLTELIGPHADHMHEFLDSEEALGIVLNAFMPVLEGFQDEWYEQNWID